MSEKQRALLIPEFDIKLEAEIGPDKYVLRASQELTGRMREYEISLVIAALEAVGYEVRKKQP